MLEQIKRISKQTEEAGVPTRFLYGTVTKLSPLTVFVDNRFHLSGSAVVCLRELFGHDHTIPPHSTKESSMHTHGTPSGDTEAAGEHSHSVPAQQTDTGGGLAEGDKVVLLRNQGGQEYLIIGRV